MLQASNTQLADMISLIQKLLDNRMFTIIRAGQFILALIIFAYAALTASPYGGAEYSDSTLHFVGNFLLIMSAFVATFGRFKLWILVAFLVPYSVLIELSQYFAPTRQVDVRDLIANFSGLGAGFATAMVIQAIWQKLVGTSH